MPIYLHLANLIIKKSTIQEKYTGSEDKFRIDYQIGRENYNQEDDELFSLASMNVDEFNIEKMISSGLHFDKINQFSNDFVIKPRYGTYLWSVNWLEDNGVFAWHKDCNKMHKNCARIIGEELSMDTLRKSFELGNNLLETIMFGNKNCTQGIYKIVSNGEILIHITNKYLNRKTN